MPMTFSVKSYFYFYIDNDVYSVYYQIEKEVILCKND